MTYKIAFFLLIVPAIALSNSTRIDSAFQALDAGCSKTDSLTNILILCYEYNNVDLEKGLKYADMALNMSVQLNDSTAMAKAYTYLGYSNDVAGNYHEAIKYYKQAYDLLLLIGNKRRASGILLNIGIANKNIGELDKSIEYLHQVLEEAQKNSWEKIILNVYINIGNTYREVSKFKKAKQYYLLAYEFAETHKFEREKGVIIVNIANICFNDKKYQAGLDSLFTALKIFRELDDLEGIMITSNNIGDIYIEIKQFDSALKYTEIGLKLAEDFKNMTSIVGMHNTIGKIYIGRKNYDMALEHFQKAMAISDSLGNIDDMRDVNKNIIDVYKNTGNQSKAIAALDRQLLFVDSTFSINSSRQLAMLEARLRSQERDNEIVRLKSENKIKEAEMERAKLLSYMSAAIIFLLLLLAALLYKNYRDSKAHANSLSELIATKDKFFSIIAHDLKNPIAAFKSATDIMDSEYDNLDHDFKKEIVGDLRKSAANLSNLLENLLTWSRSQQGRIEYNPADNNLGYVISNTISHLQGQADAKKISLINHAAEDIIARFDVNITMTLIRNLMSNAIKYSPEDSKIEVFASNHNNEYCVEIKDHGIGMDPEKVDSLFSIDKSKSTPGTKGESGTGLGLIVCREFAELQGGRIWAESQPGKGSSFKFTLPS